MVRCRLARPSQGWRARAGGSRGEDVGQASMVGAGRGARTLPRGRPAASRMATPRLSRSVDGRAGAARAGGAKVIRASDAVVGRGMGTFISCVPGKLAHFEGDERDERYIFERTGVKCRN